jgi:hypothetical protein
MSIKPIDLQTLFAKLDDVSKEQSLLKEQAAAQQAQEARSQVARGIQQDHSVTETPEDAEIGGVNDEEENREGRRRRRSEKKESAETENESGREVVQDPEVGKHIDISG